MLGHLARPSASGSLAVTRDNLVVAVAAGDLPGPTIRVTEARAHARPWGRSRHEPSVSA
jgi:hypothetical protein